jgi:hypothetical protein
MQTRSREEVKNPILIFVVVVHRLRPSPHPTDKRIIMLQHSLLLQRRVCLLSHLHLQRKGGTSFITNNPILVVSKTRGCYNNFVYFSSAAAASSSQHPSNNNNRVPITLYRQLLAWCRQYNDVPFDHPLPPLTIAPPQVNFKALKRLQEMRAFLSVNEIIQDSILLDFDDDDDGLVERRRICDNKRRHPAYFAMYNDALLVNENRITFPEIPNVSALRAVIRSIFWLNNRNTIATTIEGALPSTAGNDKYYADPYDPKEQISLAFEAMKSLNLLSSNELDSRRSKRESSVRVRRGSGRSCGDVNDSSVAEEAFPDVIFHVGQVVQHRMKKWRGVIVGWTIQSSKVNDGRLSSLTTKQYSLQADIVSTMTDNNLGDNSVTKSPVQYTILVDSNDASLLRCSNSVSLESQDDLAAVDDPL